MGIKEGDGSLLGLCTYTQSTGIYSFENFNATCKPPELWGGSPSQGWFGV